MAEIIPDKTFDARGLMCPMPLVNARKQILQMDIGQVLEIVATDKGSMRDFQGWARTSKDVELVSQREDIVDGDKLFSHFVRRVG